MRLNLGRLCDGVRMKLSEIIKDVQDCTVYGSADADVRDLSYNTSSVVQGSCFVAIKGAKADGHEFIAEALKRGASVVVSEKKVEVCGGTNVVVANTRSALAAMSASYFGNPSKAFTLVGVTGTNGKTSITYLLEAIFKEAGQRPGVIGTVSYRFGDVTEPAPHTTPESYDLQKLFMKMKESQTDFCAMEVSSHALSQGRVDGCHFDAAVFTNLTPEHLDYHGDMETYFTAKTVLFESLLAKSSKSNTFAVINADDSYGPGLAEKCPRPVVFYGFGEKASVRCEKLSFDANGLKMSVKSEFGSFECSTRLCGRFNAYNILAASAVALKMGVNTEAIRMAVVKMPVVPGRFEIVENERGIIALVDYAHTPDAIENVLTNARELLNGSGKLISVFGCGGDRDRQKRPLMGSYAAKLADVVIVTSDNPRTEDPLAIIDEIMPGVFKNLGPLKDKRGYEIIPDRREAIARAVAIAKKGDVVVVAGKGHEDYQIVGTKKHHFDDREVLREMLI